MQLGTLGLEGLIESRDLPTANLPAYRNAALRTRTRATRPVEAQEEGAFRCRTRGRERLAAAMKCAVRSQYV